MNLMDVLMIVISVVVTTATTSCIAVMRGFFKTFKSIRSSQVALIRDRIVSGHDYFMNKGSIGKWSLDSLQRLFHEYESMGGNGFVKDLMADLRELPLK